MARGKTQAAPAQRIVSLTVVSGCEVSLTVNLDGDAPGVAAASSTAAPATQALLQRPLLQVAPMIDVTNRHFRMLIRCISDLPVLWTEMTWDRAILYNTPDEPEFALKKTDLDRSLESIIGFSEEERPLVFQLGGCDPDMLARSAKLAEQRGYDEINLNCGCPAATRGRSRNNYGARLMKEPHTVAAACAAMVAAVSIPVTVKCRLGCDEVDSYEELLEFIRQVAAAGVRHFIVHARKAILGLDTIKNRSVPPLRHEWVLALVEHFPDLRFSINGGVKSLDEARALLAQGVHGVMLGRRARDEPYLFARAGELYGDMRGGPTRREVLRRYCDYSARAQQAGWDAKTAAQDARALLTPLSGLFHGTRCGKKWSQALCAIMQDREALGSVAVAGLIARALETSQMTDAVLDAKPEDPLPPYVHQPHTPREAKAEEEECDECPGREPPGTVLETASEPAAAQGTTQDGPGEAAIRRPPCAKRAAPPPCSPPPPPPPPSLTTGHLSVQAACLAAASAVAVAALLVAASKRGSR